MKKLVIIGLMGLFSVGRINAQSSNKSIVIGGIESNGVEVNLETTRLIVYQALVNSKRYDVLDRYDVEEKIEKTKLKSCLGVNCLSELAIQLGATYAASLSIDRAADRIIIGVKMVDAMNAHVIKNQVIQFEDQPNAINQMVELTLVSAIDTTIDLSLQPLIWKDLPNKSNTLKRLNNSGIRTGVALITGENAGYFVRESKDGGLGVQAPVVFNLGYQFERQYVSSEKFSSLIEGVVNVSGLEHGVFIPSFSLLNGFRFGKGAWEIAFGPSLSIKQLEKVTNLNGAFVNSEQLIQQGYDPTKFTFDLRPDTRGRGYLNSGFVVAVGKTYRSGGVNIPINLVYATGKYGQSIGLSVGITTSKKERKKY